MLPAGIDCGLDCTEQYRNGTVVGLTAIAAPGSTFIGWSGNADCSDASLTMTANRSCTATFQLIPVRTLTIKLAGTGGGTVTSAPAGIDCGLDCTEQYGNNTVVGLTAIAAPGSTFIGWSGNADCSDASLTMTANRSCTATFQLIPVRTLTIKLAGTGGGTVTSAPAGIDCGLDCTEQYGNNTVVGLTAIAAPGSTFIGWSGNADCSDASLTMTANRSCTATFQLIPVRTLTIKLAGTGGGTVTSAPAGIDCGLDCTEQYLNNTVVGLTAIAAPGSTFIGWSGNADCSDASLTMTANRSCTATFRITGP